MNIPPTEIARRIENENDPRKKAEMRRALDAWRLTQGNPLTRSACRVARKWLSSFVHL